MVYEGEQEGAVAIAHKLISSSIRSLASTYFKDFGNLQQNKKPEIREKYEKISQWFENGNELTIENDISEKEYTSSLAKVIGLKKVIAKSKQVDSTNGEELLMEYLIHVLAAYSMLDKKVIESSITFQDYFSSIMPKI